MEHLVVGRVCWMNQRHGPGVWGALASPSAMLVSVILHHDLHMCECFVCSQAASHLVVADHALLSFGSAVHTSLDSDYVACHAPVSKHAATAAAAAAAAAAAVYHDRCKSGIQAQLLQACTAMPLFAATV